MARLERAPWITKFRLRGGQILHDDLTGRTARVNGRGLQTWARFGDGPREVPQVVAEGGDLAWIEALTAAGMLVPVGTTPASRVLDRYPIRARFATFAALEDRSILLAEPTGPAHARWQARALAPIEAFVWARCAGTRTTVEILDEAARAAGPDGRRAARETLIRWTHATFQLIKLMEAPAGATASPPPHVFSWIFHLPTVDDDQPGSEVDLTDYHQRDIVDADDQFDERETTLSHLLRDPTPILGGRTWGAAVAEDLVARGASLSPGDRVVEVGGGTGWFARRVLDARPGLDYTIVDLSPALQRAQAARLGSDATLVLGDATRLPLPDGSVDVLLSNEVIADLASEIVAPEAPPEVVRRCRVEPASTRRTNVGSLLFLEEIYRVLRPGGMAYVSEYGDHEGEPQEAEHLDHPEVGIEFGVLERAAVNLGFSEVAVVDANTFAHIQNVPVISVPPEQHRALRALVVALGGSRLPKRALTPEELATYLPEGLGPDHLHQLMVTPARERIMSFRPSRILALFLRR